MSAFLEKLRKERERKREAQKRKRANVNGEAPAGAVIIVSKVYMNDDGTVRHRRRCEHKHRVLGAALRCCRRSTCGVPAEGGYIVGVVYVDGKAVMQYHVVERSSRGSWSARSSRMVAPEMASWVKALETLP